MKKANWIRIIMDLLMVLAFIGLMDLDHLNIGMHERVGLGLGLLLLGHLVVNKKLVVMICKKITKPNIPIKIRVGYIIDGLLLWAGVVLMVTGIGISQTLFTGVGFADPLAVANIHNGAANLALGLAMAHLLLHWRWISGMGKMLKKTCQTSHGRIGVITGTLLLVFLVGGVIYVDQTVPFPGEPNLANMVADEMRGSPAQAAELPRFTQAELAACHGRDGQPAYIAVSGTIYDVSGYFINGEHHGALAGQDLTGQVTGRKCINALYNHAPVVGVLATNETASPTTPLTTSGKAPQGDYCDVATCGVVGCEREDHDLDYCDLPSCGVVGCEREDHDLDQKRGHRGEGERHGQRGRD